jgi:hypothetical protein
MGKRRTFCWVCHALRLRRLDSQAAFGGRLICILFYFDLWMNYGWTTTLLFTNHTSFTCYWLSKKEAVGWTFGMVGKE